MNSEVTLLLICTFFSKALSLTCHECLPIPFRDCGETHCPDQCLTATIYSYNNYTTDSKRKTHVSIQSCGEADRCVSGSLNLGAIKMTHNAECCGTDLCNNETLPVLPQQTPNGRKCYTCDDNGCSGIMSCVGNEDRCIVASVQEEGKTLQMKGCASNNTCNMFRSMSTGGFGISDVQCCEESLCNLLRVWCAE